jgi:hypothetical protein
MSSTRVLSVGLVAVSFLLGVLGAVAPPPVHAAWVNSAGTAFQVGGALTTTVVPTLPSPAGTLVDPTCGAQGGTSLALVPGFKLSQAIAATNPVVLVVSCLDNGSSATIRSRLNFVGVNGQVVKQLSTKIAGVTAAPSTGWAHFVYRPDKGDLLGCGANGALYSIDFSSDTNTPDGTATPVTPLPSAATTCKGLTWDAEAEMIYLGLVASGNGRVIRFKQGLTTLDRDFTNLPCIASGLATSGGVLLMSCQGTQTIRRLDKDSQTGASLGANSVITATGLGAFNPEPGLGDLACDPKTFQKDVPGPTGKDLFRDGLWSRRGANGNGVVAVEFPAFTCGMPSSSVVIQGGVSYSPLAAGLSAPSGSTPGALPKSACFVGGLVKDTDGDGLPDCWETSGTDFDGDNTVDLPTLCVSVPANGVYPNPAVTECADPYHKDLFVEIDYMPFHKPDPLALTQTQPPAALVNGVPVGVKSIREAFAAAPVANPQNPNTPLIPPTPGISIHFQVDEQLTHFDQVIFTPCTASAGTAGKTTVDFDDTKKANFGTAAERGSLPLQTPNIKKLNAKRLAFRYVVFAHDLAPLASNGGLGSSGCAELGGDDGVVALGSFSGTVAGHTGGVGSTDEQAGTLMHEFGHLLGLRHGGDDAVNCKPNYRSVMNYNRQFTGTPIVGRRLDYSRSEDPVLADPLKTGFLAEASLNENDGLGTHSSLAAIPPFFPAPDRIAFGPSAWGFADTSVLAPAINWNRNTAATDSAAAVNLNDGSGCSNLNPSETLFGHDDWSNILYRASAAIDFAGGRSNRDSEEEITQATAESLYLGTDNDGNFVGDGTDCGGTLNLNPNGTPDGTTSNPCNPAPDGEPGKHRIDIKPSFPFPKTIDPGTESNLTVAIFSEPAPLQAWNASTQVLLNDLANFPLTFRVEPFQVSVKVNNQGGGTCSISDVADPITGQKDGIKDLKCQFPVGPDLNGNPLPLGTHFGVVNGWFFDPLTGQNRAFTARQEVTIVD